MTIYNHYIRLDWGSLKPYIRHFDGTDYPICIKSCDFYVSFDIRDSDGASLDISNTLFDFVIRDINGTIVLSTDSNLAFGIDTNNDLTLHIPKTVTALLVEGTYKYSIDSIEGGIKTRVLSGEFKVIS